MDWFGVCVLACVTALGGGTLRDTAPRALPADLGRRPDAAADLLRRGARHHRRSPASWHALRWPFLLLDALGLVIFTIIGCNVALEMGQSPVIVIVAGMITGIAGGILRDILCNDVPLVFSSELYATVSIVTGALYYSRPAVRRARTISSSSPPFVVGFTLRVLAIVFKLEMPKFVYDKDLR